MRRSIATPLAATAALLALLASYACSSEGAADPGLDGGALLGPDGSGAEADGGGSTSDANIPSSDASITNTDASGDAGDASADGSTGAGDAGDAGSDAGDAGSDAGDAGSVVEAGVDAGPPAVRFVGRFDKTPVGGPTVSFPGAQIIARFSGTEVKATFSDELLYTDYGPSRWQVTVDGVTTILALSRAQASYTLATALPAIPHTVELFRLSEPEVGTSQFHGFDFSGGALLPPPPPKARHLEFLGDSASSGYGIDGAGPGCSFSSATENARKSYPALIANDLGADHHNLSVAGRGLYWNYLRVGDPDVYSLVYPRTLPFVVGSVWDFTEYTPDLVWMTLGGNDWDQPNPGDPAPPFAAFQAKYDEMVTLVRAKHPNAQIVCAVAASLSNDYPVGYNAYTNVKTAATNVVAAKVAGGDAKISFFEFTRATDADLTGCEYHPNAAKHRAMADEAIPVIKAKTGWL
jgi:hypothetical protein